MKIYLLFSIIFLIVLPLNAVDNFSFGLYSQVSSSTTGNIILSPFSAKMALSMASEGGAGQTQQQILASCNLPTNQQKRLTQMQTLMKGLQQSEEQNFTLTVANSLWTSQNNPPLQSYINTVQQNYLAKVSALDFGDPTVAANTINNWVSENTEDLINNLISPDSISVETYMILVNAIYFKGLWETKFNTVSTKQKQFQMDSKSFVIASLMSAKNVSYNYYSDENIQLVELPYDGEQMVMDIILPNNMSLLSSVESNLLTNFNSYIQNMELQQVDLFLPKFKFDIQQSLKSYLQKMGITEAFSSSANFTGIDGKTDLSITSVIQQAYIEVDENGTKAAAATAIYYTNSIPLVPVEPIVVNCDHPFVFIIRNINTQQIYFIGRVVDPTSSS